MKRLYSKAVMLFLYCLSVSLLMSSCERGLDYTNNTAISPDNVWKDQNMIKAYLNDIYGSEMPGWSFNGNDSDEGINSQKSLGNYQRGIISVGKVNLSINYGTIEKINYLLDHLESVSENVLSADLKNQYKGEAKFWRAWKYWGMVNSIGGVPLILHSQSIENIDALFVPRNKTSECVAQIVKDLDDAIAALPGVYSNSKDYGRITKVAAMGLKGRILLTYASPLFNPNNAADRWQAAYKACKEAVDYGASQGHGLYSNFRKIWYDERNKEVIMVNQFFYPGHPTWFNQIRPLALTKDATNDNQPYLSLLLAFPKKDGSAMQFDKNMLDDPIYNAQFLTDFFTNRDDRFYATVFCGGTPYPTPDEVPPYYVKGKSFWTTVWSFDQATGRYINIANTIHPGATGGGISGFYDRKGLDTTVVASLGDQAQTDWIEMRYAELLMNYGECANEVSKSSEALQVLKDIRKRAGIIAGPDENYGITAKTQAEIREAYIKERQVEFAFENKRLGDLRRWKRYDILNNQGARHGLYLTLKDGEMVTPSDNIMTASVRAKLKANYIDNLDGDPAFKFNLDLNHWFYALNPSQITQSKDKLLQNNEWGGTFDPLQ